MSAGDLAIWGTSILFIALVLIGCLGVAADAGETHGERMDREARERAEEWRRRRM